MYREAQKLLLVDLEKAYDRMVVNLSTVYGLETATWPRILKKQNSFTWVKN